MVSRISFSVQQRNCLLDKKQRLSHEGHLLYKYTANASHHHAAHGPHPQGDGRPL